MAYPEAFGNDPDAQGAIAVSGSRIMGWLGALSSVALLAGLGVWVHDLATRDARAVPVVRAMEGPARVQPADPGGFEAAHQGFAVNAVASDTPVPPVGERVVIAPEPVGPSVEDIGVPVATAPPPDPATSLRNAIDGALSEVLGTGVLPAPDSGDGAAPAPEALDLRPRPQKRPDLDIVTRAVPAAALPSIATRPEAIDPDLIPPGTRLVQLGSFDTEDGALSAWGELSGRFGDYMAPKSRVIEVADLGGQTVYRLQAYGFEGLSDARSFCAVLLAEKADCIPALKR
jgi:hypothetical protein